MTTSDQARDDHARVTREAPPAGLDEGLGGGATATRVAVRMLLHLVAPALEDVVGIEAQVDGVVAQEALRVDRRRQLVVVAVLERGEIAQPDLRVALGAIQVDALALAGGLKRLADRRRRSGVDRVSIAAEPLPRRS